METEFEAKAIKIDKDIVRSQLKELGAELVFGETLFTRAIFDNEELEAQGAWLRLRDEGEKVTLALKQVVDENSISGMSEVSFCVSSFESANKLLIELGYRVRNFQQNFREEWKTDDAVFDIDTWPMIDPYLEIEAADEQTVKTYFEKLGFDYSLAYFGSSDVVYRNVYGIDIHSRPELVFHIE